MTLHLERVGGVKVRTASSLTAPDHGITAGQLVAYVVSGLAGLLFGVHVTGPWLAGLIFGG